MTRLQESLANASKEAFKDSAAKLAEPILLSLVRNHAGGEVAAAALGAVVKEVVALVVGPVLGHLITIGQDLHGRLNELERRVVALEAKQARDLLAAQAILCHEIQRLAEAHQPNEQAFQLSRISSAAVLLEHLLGNTPKLDELDQMRTQFLLAMAASVHAGGERRALGHLQICTDILVKSMAPLEAELLDSERQYKGWEPRYEWQETTKLVRGFEVVVGPKRRVLVNRLEGRHPSSVRFELEPLRELASQIELLRDGLRFGDDKLQHPLQDKR